MSAELIAIIAMGFLIIGAQTAMFIYLLQRMDRIEDRLTALEVGQVELKGRMTSLGSELKQDMKSLESELKQDMKSLESELKGEMADLRVEMVERMSTLEVSLTDRVARLEGVVLARTESDNGTVGVAGDN